MESDTKTPGGAASREQTTCKLGSLVEGVANELAEDELRRFAALFSDVDRTDFMLHKNNIQEMLNDKSPEAKVTPDFCQKDAAASQKMRTEGNRLFAEKKFGEALKFFNKGLYLAPFLPASGAAMDVKSVHGYVASEELLMVLGNRSAALQFLRFYELSIRDIDLAVEWGYPSEQLFKLWDRKGKCLSHLARKAEAIEYFTKGIESLKDAKLDAKGQDIWTQNFTKQIEQTSALTKEQLKKRKQATENVEIPLPETTGPKSARFECGNNGWGLSMTERMGRQVVAKDEVMIGDVLVVEKPLASILYASFYGSFCYNCLIQVKAPIPCYSCSAVSFCSVACQEEAWRKYHNIECKYLSWLSDQWATKLGHLALRVTLSTPYKTLREYFAKSKFEYNRPDLMSGFDKEGVYRSNYHSIFTLVTNGDLRLLEDLLPFSIMAIMMLKVIKESPDYWREAKELGDTQEEAERIVATSIMHHIQVIQCNAIAVSVMKMTTDFRECQPLDIGLGIYPTMALINHSCDPNVEVTFYGDTSVAQAVRDIKPGEPIYIYYAMCYYTNPQKERQMYYQTQFYFDCQCEACSNGWPMWDEIECNVPVLLCGKCGEDMPTTQPVVLDCPHCGRSQDMGEVLYRLQVSHDMYALAMKDTFKGQVDAALPVLEEHLRLMQKYIKRPWRDMVSCMGTLKQIYNIKAFFYSIGKGN